MKRRVIAIAVVLAAVGIAYRVLLYEEPHVAELESSRPSLEEPAMVKRVVSRYGDEATELYWEWSRGEKQGQRTGPCWRLWASESIEYEEYENGKIKHDSITSRWNSDGKIVWQARGPVSLLALPYGSPKPETRTSPPWWPHPPLIDLREFEE